jgi:hypothetical protein
MEVECTATTSVSETIKAIRIQKRPEENAFFQVMGNSHLLKVITSHQNGRKYKRWYDGDHACSMGHLDLLKSRYKFMHFSQTPIDNAVRSGSMEVINWLRSNGMSGTTDVSVKIACEMGFIDILKWLLENYEILNTDGLHEALRSAIGNRHKDVIEFLTNKESSNGYGLIPLKSDFERACAVGTYEIIEMIYNATSNGRGGDLHYCVDDLLQESIKSANIDGILWISQNYNRLSLRDALNPSKLLTWAIRLGRADVLQALLNGFDLRLLISEARVNIHANSAATTGRIEILRVFVGNGWMPTEGAIYDACKNGHTEVVKYALEENLFKDISLEKLMVDAFACSHTQTLTYVVSVIEKMKMQCISERGKRILRAVKEGSDIYILYREFYGDASFLDIDKASKLEGSLDVVIWLHESMPNVVCTKQAMDHAASRGDIKLVMFLHENRKEGCTTNAMDNASRNRHYDVVKWLHKNRKEGCTTFAMDFAAENGDLDMVKWFHDNRKEGCTTYAMNKAAEMGHLAVVIWLHKNRKEGCTQQAVDRVALVKNLEMVRWLLSNREEGFSIFGITIAIRGGSFKIIKCMLGSNKCCITPMRALEIAMSQGNYQVCYYLGKTYKELRNYRRANDRKDISSDMSNKTDMIQK